VRFKVRCANCGKEWWIYGSYDPDTNAISFGDDVNQGDSCHCSEDMVVIDEAYDE
jgi:hypothetical protein